MYKFTETVFKLNNSNQLCLYSKLSRRAINTVETVGLHRTTKSAGSTSSSQIDRQCATSGRLDCMCT